MFILNLIKMSICLRLRRHNTFPSNIYKIDSLRGSDPIIKHRKSPSNSLLHYNLYIKKILLHTKIFCFHCDKLMAESWTLLTPNYNTSDKVHLVILLTKIRKFCSK